MSLAIRAITRIQDADDSGLLLGPESDGWVIVWDNDTARFLLAASSLVAIVGTPVAGELAPYQVGFDPSGILYIGKPGGNIAVFNADSEIVAGGFVPIFEMEGLF